MKQLNYFYGLLIILLTASCATWRTGDIDSQFSFENHEENSLKYEILVKLVSYEYLENEKLKPNWLDSSKQKKATSIITESYQDTGLFRLAAKNKNPNFKAKVVIRREVSFSDNMRWITPISLYLIPRSVNEKVIVTTKYYNDKDALIGMTEFSDNLVTWHQLFMILGLPFTGTPNGQVMSTIDDLVRSSIEQALQDGYFNSFEEL